MNPGNRARRLVAILLIVLSGAFFAERSGASGGRQETPQKPVEVTVTAGHYAFSPSRIEVPQDAIVKVTLQAEDMAHSFTIDDYRIAKRAAPGRPVTFEFRADRAGSFTFYCSLTADDRCKEMRGSLVVRATPR